MSVEYNPSLVAFMDILGFQSLVKRLDKDPELHSNIYKSLSRIHSLTRKSSDPKLGMVHDNLNVSVFSDCIAITCPMEEMSSLFWTCGYLQADLLFYGLLVRGAISYGRVVHQDNLLYGNGLIDAYKLESQTACYPRIIFNPNLLGSLAPHWKDKFMRFDQDGFLAIEPFKFDAGHPYHPALEEDGWCPRYLYLVEVANKIQEGFSKADSPGEKAKWQWLESGYNEAVATYNGESCAEPIPSLYLTASSEA